MSGYLEALVAILVQRIACFVLRDVKDGVLGVRNNRNKF